MQTVQKYLSNTLFYSYPLQNKSPSSMSNRRGEKGKQVCHLCRSLASVVLLKLLTKIVKHFYNLTSSLTKGKSMKKIQKSKKVHYPVQYFALNSCHLQYMKNKPRSVITLKYTASIFQYFTHIFYSGRGDLLKTLLLKY